MSNIAMPDARLVDDDGEFVFVQPLGMKLAEGHRYYDPKHDHGGLFCPCCSAPVSLRTQGISRGGSTLPTIDPGFVLQPGIGHDEACAVPMRPKSEHNKTIDLTKGYRIHINTREVSEILGLDFNTATGAYRKVKGRIQLRSDLRDRELKSVHNVGDLLKIMQNGQHQRLRNSVVIFNNKTMPWTEFFVRESEREGVRRFADLHARILKGGPRAEIPCAIVFEPNETKWVRQDKPWSKGQILAYRDGDRGGINKSVLFELEFPFLRQLGHDHFSIDKDQLYLVTGIARRGFVAGSGQFETVKISVDSPEAITTVTRETLLKAERKQRIEPAPYEVQPSRFD